MMAGEPANVRRLIRQTLTIARRDFIATVATPMFLLFLLSPLIMMAFATSGMLGARSLVGSVDRQRMIVLTDPALAPTLATLDQRLRDAMPRGDDLAPLTVRAPEADPRSQAERLFAMRDQDVVAVMFGSFERPTILFGNNGAPESRFLAALAEQTLRADRSGGPAALSKADRVAVSRTRASVTGYQQSAFFAVFGIFFLTLFLSGQAVGTMAEERGNKVIEVLAAAVPLEAVFLGKLLGMLGVSFVFVAFWGAMATVGGQFLPPALVRTFSEVGPAIGFPMFLPLFFVYFTTAYLLLGAVFLGVGAQATTVREIQLLSLPITITQMGMFGLSASAAAAPGSGLALFAELFPLSSPFAMAAHAANRPELWPHLLAIAWQLLWVAVVIAIGARAFRRGVLQSGGPRFRLRRSAS